MCQSFLAVRTCWPVFTALYDLAQLQSPPRTGLLASDTIHGHLETVLNDEVIQSIC